MIHLQSKTTLLILTCSFLIFIDSKVTEHTLWRKSLHSGAASRQNYTSLSFYQAKSAEWKLCARRFPFLICRTKIQICAFHFTLDALMELFVFQYLQFLFLLRFLRTSVRVKKTKILLFLRPVTRFRQTKLLGWKQLPEMRWCGWTVLREWFMKSTWVLLQMIWKR